MPIARVQMEDGRIARVEVPEGTTPEQATAYARLMTSPSATPAPVPETMTGRFLAGLDAATGEVQTGVKQLLGRATPADVDALRQANAPLLDTRAGMVGHLLGRAAPGIAATLVTKNPATLAGMIGQQGAIGAGLGLLDPVGEGESRGGNAVIGAGVGALGGAAAQGLSRLVTPMPHADPARLALADAARARGIPVSVAQATDSPLLKHIERAAGGLPEAEAAKAAAINRIAAKTIGQNADALTNDVLDAAHAQLGQRFGQLAKGSVLNTTHPEYVKSVQGLIDDYLKLTPEARKAVPGAEGWIKDLAHWHRLQSVDGDVYQANRSIAAAKARTAKGAEAAFYHKVVEAMDSAAPQGPAWAEVRNQYRNLAQLERNQSIDEMGNVKGSALWNIARRQKGHSDLEDVARIAKAFPPIRPNDAAPGEAVLRTLANTSMGMGAGTTAAYMAGQRDPSDLAMGALAGYGLTKLGPRALEKLINQQYMRQYLTRGLLGGTNVSPMLAPAVPLLPQHAIERDVP